MSDETKWCIIPAYIYADKRLNSTQKLLAGRIVALSNEKGFCYASNEYFAEEMGRHSVNISHDISFLVGLGVFRRVIYRKNKRVSQRRLYPMFEVLANTLTTTKRKRYEGISENAKESNTVEINSIDTPSVSKEFLTEAHNIKNLYHWKKAFPQLEKTYGVKKRLDKYLDWLAESGANPREGPKKFYRRLLKEDEKKAKVGRLINKSGFNKFTSNI